MRVVQRLEFGDTEGHPFHGNQWTGGLATEHGEATGGISSNLKELGLSPATTKTLTSAFKSKGFTINKEKQAQLQAAKEEALTAIGAKLGYTPEQSAAAVGEVNKFMQSWYAIGGQSATRTDMETAWVKLREGGTPETDLERGAAMQKAYTDMVWDTKFGPDVDHAEVIRGVSGQYAGQIELADKLGESWTANTFPLTSWAVPDAERSVTNWVGSGTLLHGDAQKDETFAIYSGEPNLRESGLKVKGEFIMDGEGAVDDGNTTISRLEGGHLPGVSYGVNEQDSYVAEGMKFHEATGGGADDYALGRASFNGVDMGRYGTYAMSSPGLQSALGLDQPLRDEPTYDRFGPGNLDKSYEQRQADEKAAESDRYTAMSDNAKILSDLGHTPATMRDIATNYSTYIRDSEEANKLEEGARRGIDPESSPYSSGISQPRDQKSLDYYKKELIPSYREEAARSLAAAEKVRTGLGLTNPLVPPRPATQIEKEVAEIKAKRGY